MLCSLVRSGPAKEDEEEVGENSSSLVLFPATAVVPLSLLLYVSYPAASTDLEAL